jgi:hypothetical protein
MLFLINVNGNDHKFCKNCNMVCKIFVFKFLSNFILVLSIAFVLQELLLYFILFYTVANKYYYIFTIM